MAELRRRLSVPMEKILADLEQRQGGADNASKRDHPRFNYKAQHVELTLHEAGRSRKLCAVGFDISDSGAALIVDQFIYAGNACSLTLVTTHGTWEQVAGRVRRCTYIEGSGSAYEIGVAFDLAIDVARFCPAARLQRVLVVDDSPVIVRLMQRVANDTGIQLTCVTSGAAALDAVKKESFDAILLDILMPDMDGFAAYTALRDAGCSSAVIAFSASCEPAERQRYIDHGFDDVLSKPFSRESLALILRKHASEWVESTLAHQPDCQDEIGHFVERAQAWRKELIDAIGQQDRSTLLDTVRALEAEASLTGFEVLADAAHNCRNGISREEPWPQISKLFTRLLRLMQRVRGPSKEGASTNGATRPTMV